MQRSNQFLKKEEDKKDNDKIIFLDIDGVFKYELQQDHFEHDFDKTYEYVKENYPKYNYDSISLADIAATYYDFYSDAVGNFKRLVEDTNAKVVISSDWRNTKSLYQLKALLHLHDLDMYIDDKILGDFKKEYYINKEDAIDEYIERVKPSNYVIIDDYYGYVNKYKLKYDKVDNLFSKRDYNYSSIILSDSTYSMNQVYDLLHCKSDDREVTTFKVEDYIFDNYKVKYLTSYKLDKRFFYKEYIEYFLNKMSFESDDDFIIYDSDMNDLIVNGSFDNYGIYTFNVSNKTRDELNYIKRKILSKKR